MPRLFGSKSLRKIDESQESTLTIVIAKMARLLDFASVPSGRQKCEPSRYQCTLALPEVRFYPPEGSVLKTYDGVDALLDVVRGSNGV